MKLSAKMGTLFLLCLLLLPACGKRRQTSSPRPLTTGETDNSGGRGESVCRDQPPAAETARALLACLPADAGADEAEALLRRWRRIDDEWGSVTAVDLLPGGREELAVSYHRNLQEVIWNPQGRLLLLQQGVEGWKIAFDSAGHAPVQPNGRPWENWTYRPVEIGDATGDGREDLLLELVYSNASHVAFTRHALLAAHEASVPSLVLLESGQYGRYRIDEKAPDAPLVFTANLMGRQPITRTYAFAGRGFTQVAERIDPGQATNSVRLPDGSTWLTFDSPPHIGAIPANNLSGLYRLAEEDLTHFSLPQAVRALTVAPGGELYVGAGCGLLRYRGETAEELAPLDCGAGGPLDGGGPVTAVAVAETGAVWVGTPFSLARYDGTWKKFAVNASRLLLAPDGSVWAVGWDGRAGSGCCLAHLSAAGPVTYTYAAPLPVSPQLEAAIRALAPE